MRAFVGWLRGENPVVFLSREREPSGIDPSGRTHLRILLRAVVIARGRRQLQDRRALTGDQPRDHDDLAVREFERVVVDVLIMHVDLPESVSHARPAERAESALVLDGFVKSPFRAWKYTDGDAGFANGAKPRVIVFTKSVATSLSPTLAGREATRCRL
jgi:hypothetical protein